MGREWTMDEILSGLREGESLTVSVNARRLFVCAEDDREGYSYEMEAQQGELAETAYECLARVRNVVLAIKNVLEGRTIPGVIGGSSDGG